MAVLGICAIIFPLPVDKSVLKRDFPVSIVVTALVLMTSCASLLFGGRFFEYTMDEEVGKVYCLLLWDLRLS